MVSNSQLGAGPTGIVTAGPRGSKFIPAAAQVRHGVVDGEQRFGGDCSEGDDDLGFDGGNLPHQKRRTGFTLFTLGRAIVWWTALDDVCDVDLLAFQSHRLDHVVEQLPGTAYEGFALLIFVSAGSFADEHQFRLRISYAKNDL